MNADFDDARRGLERLGFYTAEQLDGVEIARLGGLTNRVFMVDGPRGRHVLRIPGKGTETYINRRVEAVAARAAAKAGVSPPVIAFSDDGLMLTVAIDNAATMTSESFNANPAAVARAGAALRKLHDSGETFDFRFELFSMIDDYLRILKAKNASVPDGYPQALAAAESVRQALNAHALPLVSCHCDPLSENFLDTGDRMWIVDWEYSGMNDPIWDIGDFAVEAQLTPANEKVLQDSYFGDAPTPAELGRYVIYKAMCDLLWTLWGLIQHADANPADDFWAYANRRFARCKTLMDSPEFPMHVQNVLRGDGRQRASRRAEAPIMEQDRAMEPTKTGGCLCGGVRYEVHGPLRPVVACHCTQCRKTSGHYVAATDCAVSDIKIVETTLRWFKSSDVAERGFCSRCGGNVFWRRFGKPRISICAGTLDGETGLRMALQIHAESKGDYYDLPPVPVIDQAELDQELS